MEQNIEKQNTKRRSTFAVLFYINRTKIRKDGMCQLLCKVSIDAEWAQIGTKVSVNPGYLESGKRACRWTKRECRYCEPRHR